MTDPRARRRWDSEQVKAKDRRGLFLRVEALANYEPVNMSDCMAFTVREIDRAVRKARKEITDRGTECPVCGWKPKRAKKGTRT